MASWWSIGMLSRPSPTLQRMATQCF